MISQPLRVELHFEIRSPVLMQHKFFFFFAKTMPAGMRQVCHTATTPLQISTGDILFGPGEVLDDPCMLFLVSGKLLYTHHDGYEKVIENSGWICEAPLW